MKNIILFVFTGLSFGLVVSYLITLYFKYGVNSKSRSSLQIVFWSFYVFSLLIVPSILFRYIEDSNIFGSLERYDRVLFFAIWFIPTVITAVYCMLQTNKRRKAEKKQLKEKEYKGEIPSRWRWLVVPIFPAMLYFDFFIAEHSMVLRPDESAKAKWILLFLWSIPLLSSGIQLEVKIYKMKKQKKEAFAEENISPTTT